MSTAVENLKTSRRPLVEQCDGCERTLAEGDQKFCQSFAFPDTKWRLGACSMATHLKTESSSAEKRRVGQQKQKKR